MGSTNDSEAGSMCFPKLVRVIANEASRWTHSFHAARYFCLMDHGARQWVVPVICHNVLETGILPES